MYDCIKASSSTRLRKKSHFYPGHSFSPRNKQSTNYFPRRKTELEPTRAERGKLSVDRRACSALYPSHGELLRGPIALDAEGEKKKKRARASTQITRGAFLSLTKRTRGVVQRRTVPFPDTKELFFTDG